MSARLMFGLKMLLWLVLLGAGVIAIRIAGEVMFYFPGVIAKRLSYMLTGSGKGLITSILFYFIAAVFVLGLAVIGWGVIRVDRWLDERRSNPAKE